MVDEVIQGVQVEVIPEAEVPATVTGVEGMMCSFQYDENYICFFHFILPTSI